MQYPLMQLIHNASTHEQNEMFIEMPILKLPV